MILKDREAGQYDVGMNPAEVQSRVASEIDPEGLLFDSGDKPFVGVVGNGSFRLHIRGFGTNSFRPNLYGTIEPISKGSRISLRIGPHPFVRPFMMIWLGGVATLWAIGLLFLLFSSLAGTPNPEWKLVLFAPPGMFVGGIALVWFGHFFCRYQERRLLAFADHLWGGKQPE